MARRREQSIERAVAVAAILCALAVALAAAAAVSLGQQRRAEASPLADSVASAIGERLAPQPLLTMLARGGTIRAATLYGRDGVRIAATGTMSPGGEVVCRSVGGDTLCIEAATAVRGSAMPPVVILIAAIVIGTLTALLLTRLVARRIDEIRIAIESSSRVPDFAGVLGALAASTNRLLDDVQQRDLTLRRRTLELETANKDLEAFASAVSHDLRGPLGSITGFAQALEEDFVGQLDDAARECVHWIRDGCDQMQALIDGLLQVSRVSRAEMQREDVDLSAIARQIAEGLRRSHPERSVEFDIADGVVANGDERMLRAVMENLIGNAWKFTGKQPHARIEVGVADDNGRPAYFVRDNGAGFDPAHAAKMFRPFQRLHSEKEFSGTGIGLATVSKIVQRHGGRVWAEGEPERGATIYFTVER